MANARDLTAALDAHASSDAVIAALRDVLGPCLRSVTDDASSRRGGDWRTRTETAAGAFFRLALRLSDEPPAALAGDPVRRLDLAFHALARGAWLETTARALREVLPAELPDHDMARLTGAVRLLHWLPARWDLCSTPAELVLPLYDAWMREVEDVLEATDAESPGRLAAELQRAARRLLDECARDADRGGRWLVRYLMLDLEERLPAGFDAVPPCLEGFRHDGRQAASWSVWADALQARLDAPVAALGEGAPPLSALWVPPACRVWRAEHALLPDPRGTRRREDAPGLVARLLSRRLDPGRPVLLLGPPGAGKTSFCVGLARALAAPACRVHALLLPVAELAADRPLPEMVRDWLQRADSPLRAHANDALGLHGLILIFDGLEDLPRCRRGTAAAWLRRLAAEAPGVGAGGARVLVTARDGIFPPGDTSLPADSVVVRLAPFDSERVASWTRRWHTATGASFDATPWYVPPPEDDPEADATGLATVPLTLTLLAELARRGAPAAPERTPSEYDVLRLAAAAGAGARARADAPSHARFAELEAAETLATRIRQLLDAPVAPGDADAAAAWVDLFGARLLGADVQALLEPAIAAHARALRELTLRVFTPLADEVPVVTLAASRIAATHGVPATTALAHAIAAALALGNFAAAACDDTLPLERRAPGRYGRVHWLLRASCDLTGALLGRIHHATDLTGGGGVVSGWDNGFIGADLSFVRLAGARLARARLVHAALIDADLQGADLTHADLRGAFLSGVDLTGARLGCASLRGADLTGARLLDADLAGADLGRALLAGADLTQARLEDANLEEATLMDANLGGADLRGARLVRADLSGVDATHATFVEADLRDASLTVAYLGRANLRHADLTGARLDAANLQDADVTGASVTRAQLERAHGTPRRDLEQEEHTVSRGHALGSIDVTESEIATEDLDPLAYQDVGQILEFTKKPDR
jgi:uncharacterized protein YjbI with pentapeptide repeats